MMSCIYVVFKGAYKMQKYDNTELESEFVIQ